MDSPRRSSRMNFETSETFFFSLVVYINFVSLCFNSVRIFFCYDLINPYLLEKVFRVSFQSTLTPFLSGGESRGRIRDRAWSRILSHRLLRKEPFLLLSLSPFQGQTSRERLEKRRESLGPTETTRTPTVPLSFFPFRTE